MTKPNLFLSLLLSLLTLIPSCKEDEGKTMVVLNTCIETSTINIKLNKSERVIIKSCRDGEVAFIRMKGIDNSLTKPIYSLNSKADTLILTSHPSGSSEIRLKTSNLEAGDYSTWVSDTIIVSTNES